MHERKIRLLTAIDIGSNLIRMIIAQINIDGKLIILEELKHTTNIGRDTFTYEKISVNTIYETCSILKKFTRLMKDYRVVDYRAVSTSGIREAENRGYVLEQIKLKTGLKIDIINNAEERFLTYKALRRPLPSVLKMKDEGLLIINVGSGGVEISLYMDGTLKFTKYIKIGSLRIRAILSDLENKTLDFPEIMEEFIESKTYTIEPYLKKFKIKHFIGLGGLLPTIYELCNTSNLKGDNSQIKKCDLQELYSKITTMSTEQMMKEYKLDDTDIKILLPSVIIFKRFLDITIAQSIHVPKVSLRHGLIEDMLDKLFGLKREKEFINDIIHSVRCIGEKYKIDHKHSHFVEKICLLIFEKTKKIHRLNEREGFYLQIAAILHDIGKFNNLDKYHIYSYDIIRSQNIMSFSNRELEIIANVTQYHGETNPHFSHRNYTNLMYEDQIIVSKLSAILKLAVALDISHKQKINVIDICTSNNKLYLLVESVENILFEKWTFYNQSNFFEEVMGIKPIIKQKEA